MKMNERYFECQNCGQAVQGWHAANEWVDCCANKNMVEIEGPPPFEPCDDPGCNHLGCQQYRLHQAERG